MKDILAIVGVLLLMFGAIKIITKDLENTCKKEFNYTDKSLEWNIFNRKKAVRKKPKKRSKIIKISG